MHNCASWSPDASWHSSALTISAFKFKENWVKIKVKKHKNKIDLFNTYSDYDFQIYIGGDKYDMNVYKISSPIIFLNI